MSDLTLDVGLAAKLKVAFARNGWTADLIDKACEGNRLGQFRQVLLGRASIKDEYVIDCDATPFTPNDWTVEEHQKGGQFQWNKDAQRDALWLAKDQEGEKWWPEGIKLRKELSDKPVLNANVLDYLLANPHLIPDGWESRYVFFWGTIYLDRHGSPHVRCLLFSLRGSSKWSWSSSWLSQTWRGTSPAALRAS